MTGMFILGIGACLQSHSRRLSTSFAARKTVQKTQEQKIQHETPQKKLRAHHENGRGENSIKPDDKWPRVINRLPTGGQGRSNPFPPNTHKTLPSTNLLICLSNRLFVDPSHFNFSAFTGDYCIAAPAQMHGQHVFITTSAHQFASRAAEDPALFWCINAKQEALCVLPLRMGEGDIIHE